MKLKLLQFFKFTIFLQYFLENCVLLKEVL